jgi:hypothetical protein
MSIDGRRPAITLPPWSWRCRQLPSPLSVVISALMPGQDAINIVFCAG